MTQYTPNVHLPLYEGGDALNVRDQYNGAMGIIDTQFASVATENTTVQNLIANINRDITTLNEDIVKVNDDISALQTLTGNQGNTLSTLTDQVNTIDSEVGQIGAKATQNAQNIATQSGYFSALGVTTLDDAIDLKSDIDDAHSQSMTNQADIAQVKITQTQQGNTLSMHTGQIQTMNADIAGIDANIQTLSDEFDRTIAKGWNVNTVPLIPTSSSADYNATVFVNPAKSAFKIAFSVDIPTDSLNSSIHEIPGYQVDKYRYGQKLFDISQYIEPMDAAILYTCTALYKPIPTSTATSNANPHMEVDHLVLGSDGCVYFNPANTSNGWSTSQYGRIKIYAMQPLLSLTAYDVDPVIPPKDE